MIIKSVAFNEDDPDQKRMLEHANKRKNFSAYVKRLIQRDLEWANVNVLESNAYNKELLKALI